MLAEGKGNGWRYNEMPPDDKAYVTGLYGINETSKIMFGATFKLLDAAKQDQVLISIQDNTAYGKTWETMPSYLFFEELLAQLVEFYFSHPYAKEDIGEVAMADAKGWQKIGLNELEAHEPEALNKKINVG
ncbi:MAG: gluconate 2-dehydrogenase subunit 3 family protein [Segetibacter sp.]